MTDDPKPRMLLLMAEEHYWLSLGRFVDIFALAENNMQLLLRKVAKIKQPYAQALLSGVRIDAASSYIKRIAEAGEWPASKKSEFDALCLQLGEITRTRNDLLHFGAFDLEADGTRIVSNALYAHTHARIREFHVSPDVLDEMSTDLLVIICHLVRFTDGEKAAAASWAGGELPPIGAWRYTPSAPTHSHRRPRGKRRAQPRRPKPSHK